jgi:hypothetical protein
MCRGPQHRVRDFHIREITKLHSSSSAPPFPFFLLFNSGSKATISHDLQQLHRDDACSNTGDALLITTPLLLDIVPQLLLDAAGLLPDLQNLQTSINTLPDASSPRIPLYHPPRHHPTSCRRHELTCCPRTRAHCTSKPQHKNKGVESVPDDPECSRRAGSRRGEAGVWEQGVEGAGEQGARWGCLGGGRQEWIRRGRRGRGF